MMQQVFAALPVSSDETAPAGLSPQELPGTMAPMDRYVGQRLDSVVVGGWKVHSECTAAGRKAG
jgi:hypothetical protein